MNPTLSDARHLSPQPPQPVRPNPEPDVPAEVPVPDDGGDGVPPLDEGDGEAHRPGRT